MRNYSILTLCVSAVVLTAVGCKSDETLLKEPTVEITTDSPITIGSNGGAASFTYTLENPAEDGEINAASEASWIDIDDTTPEIVVLDVEPNDGKTSRTAEIVLTYTYAGKSIEDKISLEQSGSSSGGNDDEDYDYEFNAEVFYGEYYGERRSVNGTHSFATVLSNLADSEEPGSTTYTFEIFSEAPEDDHYPLPATGIYTYGGPASTDAFTISNTQYTTVNGNGMLEDDLTFVSGTLEFGLNGDKYYFDAVLTDEEGSVHHITYASKVSVIYEDMSQPTGSNRLEKDVHFEARYAEASYKSMDEDKVMHVSMEFAEEDRGDGSYYCNLHLEAYLPYSQSGDITPGTYPVSAEHTSQTISDGAILSAYGVEYPVDTYLDYIYDDNRIAWGAVKSGSMTVSGSNGNYDITFDLTTQEGYSITGTWYGPIEIEDFGCSTLTEDRELDLYWAEGTATLVESNSDGAYWLLDIATDKERVLFELCAENAPFFQGIPSATYTACTNSDNDPWSGEYFRGYLAEDGQYSGSMYYSDYDADGNPQTCAPAFRGSIAIENDGEGSYSVIFEINDDMGNTWSGEWYGEPELVNASSSTPQTTLVDDITIDLSQANSAEAYFQGDSGYYMYGNWVILISTATAERQTGVQIDLLCNSLDFDDGIPTGTYKVSTQVSSAKAGNLYPGIYDDGDTYGTMYLDYDITADEITGYACAIDGSADITNNGDSTYSISFLLYDENGHSFNGEWSGTLNLNDYSE